MDVAAVLGDEADDLLGHECHCVTREQIHQPGPAFVDTVAGGNDRNAKVRSSLHRLFHSGRLASTGYLSLLPVDHGIAHTAGMVFAPNPIYLDPKAIVELALAGGSSGIVTTFGVLGALARKAAHKVPLILKLNHDVQFAGLARNENILFAQLEEARGVGAVGVAATVYFGGPHARKELLLVSRLFSAAHRMGLLTMLFCYLHPAIFKRDDLLFAADLTAEANHQGITIGADLIKQKQPRWTGGYRTLGEGYGRAVPAMYEKLTTAHPIDLTRYQVILNYCGRSGLIHSGGERSGNPLQSAVRAAVINKRGGGMGLIAGRKAFQAPRADGVKLLHAIQDIYLNPNVSVA